MTRGASRRRKGFRLILMAVMAALLLTAPAARAASEDPIFVYTPRWKPAPPPLPPGSPVPPPAGVLEGPCGLAVDGGGNFYLSDYYHRVVDYFSPKPDETQVPTTPATYVSQMTGVGPKDGPCGLALDGLGNLYVNDFHRSVIRYAGFPAGAGTVVDSAQPTGVAVDSATNRVYVNDRASVAVYDPTGSLLGEIGAGNLVDGYGVAVSRFPATAGRVYVADAATGVIRVYEPTLGGATPVATIDGSDLPGGGFVSLRDASLAIDNQSGELYVTDTVQPEYSELSETVIRVFSAAGAYEGRLKYSVSSALPAGLAVDNSGLFSQGRVFVTSGNSELGSVYAYRPGSATVNAVPLAQAGSTALPFAAPAAPTAPQTLGEPAPSLSGSSAVAAAPAPVVERRHAGKRRPAKKPRRAARHRRHRQVVR